MKYLLIIIILILIRMNVSSQNLFTNITCNDYVKDIADGADNFWTLTDVSFVRYNKSNGKSDVFPFYNNLNVGFIKDIYEDMNGNLWSNTNDDLYKFNGFSWEKVQFKTDGGDDALNISLVWVDSKKQVWVSFTTTGNNCSLARFDGTNWKTIYKPNAFEILSFYAMAEDKLGNIWACGTNYESLLSVVTKIEKDTIYVWHTDDGLPPSNSQYNLNTIAIDSNNNIWVGNQFGASVFDGIKWGFFGYYTSALYINIQKILTDKSGNVWVCGNNGAYYYDGLYWHNYTDRTHIRYQSGVNDFCIDDSNSIWFATDLGLSRYYNGLWFYYTSGNGLPNDMCFKVTPDSKGGVLVATPNGTGSFDYNHWSVFRTENAPKSNFVNDLYFDKDENLWVKYSDGSNYNGFNGIDKFDGKYWTHYPIDSISNANLVSMAKGPDGNIWVGSKGKGISKFNGGKWETLAIGDSLDSLRSYNVIAFDSTGNIWVGTERDSLIKIHNGIPEYKALPEAFVYDGKKWKQVFGSNTNKSIYLNVTGIAVNQSNEVFMVGLMSDILCKFSGNNITQTKIENTITNSNEFSPSSVSCDKKGNLWLSYLNYYSADSNGFYTTPGGVGKFDGTNWAHYSYNDGIPGVADNCDVNKVIFDKYGNKWAAARMGIGFYDDNKWRPYYIIMADYYWGVSSIAFNSKDELWAGTPRGLIYSKNAFTSVNYKKPANEETSVQISPNPVSSKATIKYYVKEQNRVRICIYNSTGQLGMKLFDEIQFPGEKSLEFSAENLADGVYNIAIQIGNETIMRKMVVVK